jgi:hypothetical protein
MEVIVQNETSNGYYVTLVDIYKSHQRLNDSLVFGQTVHLKFPASKSKFNLKFAYCRCFRLNPRHRYVALGYKSNVTDNLTDDLHIHQAIHVRNESKANLTRFLRRIISHNCKKSSGHAHPTSSGLELLTPNRVGKVLATKGSAKAVISKHSSIKHGRTSKKPTQLKVLGEPVPQN